MQAPCKPLLQATCPAVAPHLFWMGVPEITQRREHCRAAAALAICVLAFFTVCPYEQRRVAPSDAVRANKWTAESPCLAHARLLISKPRTLGEEHVRVLLPGRRPHANTRTCPEHEVCRSVRADLVQAHAQPWHLHQRHNS